MIWYPYEQMKTMKAPYKIVDANGVYLYTKDSKLIDSVSSWLITLILIQWGCREIDSPKQGQV